MFKSAENQAAYLKYGGYGETATGKTWTACSIAIGLHQYLKSKRPVAFIDSETGSDYQVHRFKAAGIRLEVDKTRSFQILHDDLLYAEKSYDILIVDSVSHFWQELMTAYRKKLRLTRLRIWDFGPLKEEWNSQFTVPYVNSKLHILICGRAGEIWKDVQEETGPDTTEWKTVSVGSRMSAEKNLAYEPSLLVEMEREFVRDGGLYSISCTVIKERFGLLTGKVFKNPDFKDFLPHIELLNLGGEHVGFDASQTSEGMFASPETSTLQRRKQIEILLEELTGLRDKYLPGSAPKDRQAKTWIALEAFGTSSLTKMQEMRPDDLRERIGICEALMLAYVKEAPKLESEEVWRKWLAEQHAAFLAASSRPDDFLSEHPQDQPGDADEGPEPEGL